MTSSRVALLLLLSACAHDSGPSVPARVEVTSGEGQTGTIRTLLPEPIVARVLDATGAPLPGVRVVWAAEAGRIIPIAPQTDAEGRAQARWVLGDLIGPSHARANVPELEPATFTAIAQSAPQLPLDRIQVFRVPTYDGSGQVVHPDYVHAPELSPGSPHHLAITPYPFSDPKHENPSHFVGRRPDQWILEPGAPNPVASSTGGGFLSDPDMLFVPESEELWLYYRQVRNGELIYLVRSRDGVRWGAPVEVLARPSHELVSPTVVRRAPDDWWMWTVNAGATGCNASSTTVELRRSADGIRWSAPQPVALSQPDFWPWHIEVQWIPSRNEFWALYNAKTVGGCSTPALFLATSPDGLTWTVLGTPVLERGRIPEFEHVVYRSTFAYDPVEDAITFWYSGARHDGKQFVWHAAVERRRRGDVFQAPMSAEFRASLLRAEGPELEEWP